MMRSSPILLVVACLQLSGAALAQATPDELPAAQQEAIERPKDSSRTTLVEMGLLDGVPTVESTGGLKNFAPAAEVHCGLERGSTLRVEGGSLVLEPSESQFEANYDELSCLLAVITLSGATKFGFIGNEQISEQKGE
tara:strand:+ start:444 stop:857 length:414 start_codon:yes stop_codon:yes gene_type:complete